MTILLSTLAWAVYWFILSGLLLVVKTVVANFGIGVHALITVIITAVAFTITTDDFLGEDGWITGLMKR